MLLAYLNCRTSGLWLPAVLCTCVRPCRRACGLKLRAAPFAHAHSFAAPAEGATAEFHRILRYEVTAQHSAAGPHAGCAAFLLCTSGTVIWPHEAPTASDLVHGMRLQLCKARRACCTEPHPAFCRPLPRTVWRQLHHPGGEGAGHFGCLRPAGAGAWRPPEHQRRGRRRQRLRQQARAGRCGRSAATAGAAPAAAGSGGCGGAVAGSSAEQCFC